MMSDLDIIQEALKRVSSYRWVNLGTVTEGMQVLSREIEILSKERDEQEE